MKNPKLSHFTHGFGKGIKGKRTTKGSRIYSPPNPKEKGLKTVLRKIAKKRLRKTPKKKIGKHSNKPRGTMPNHIYIT
jgi:hypothetical protein